MQPEACLLDSTILGRPKNGVVHSLASPELPDLKPKLGLENMAKVAVDHLAIANCPSNAGLARK